MVSELVSAMATVQAAVEAAKEAAANVGASVSTGKEKTMAVVQEKVAKVRTHDPAEKAEADDRMQRARMEAALVETLEWLEEQDGAARRTEEEDYEERAALQGHRAAAPDSRERTQAEAAREDGARGESESEVGLQLSAVGPGVEEALVAALERSGGALPFLQAAIDVAHRRAQVEAEERAARDAKRKAEEAERKAAAESQRTEEKLESSVEKDGMVVDKKQATVAEQVAELKATATELEGRSLHLKATRVSASSAQSQKRVLKSSFSKNKKENEVYKQEMDAKLHEQLKELEALQSSMTVYWS